MLANEVKEIQENVQKEKTEQLLQTLPETDDVLKNIPKEEVITPSEQINDADDLPALE